MVITRRVFSFVVCTILTLSMAVPAPAAKYTFTFATHAIENSFRGRAELAYLKEVEKLTDNEVAFKIFWGASLMGGSEVLKGVSSGVVDTGLVNINYYAKQLLANNALNTIQESLGTYTGLVDFFNKVYTQLPALKEELNKYQNEFLFVYGCMPMTFVSTKPMTSLANLDGQKARAASRWLLPLMQELGAQPISVPWDDCNMALQTNVIDTVFSNIDSINMVKMDETAPNILIYDGYFPTSSYIITMNSKKFKRLPAAIQQKLREAGVNAMKKLPAIYEEDYKLIRDAQSKAGYKVAFITKEDVARWMGLPGIEANKKQWVQEASSAGMKDAQKFLDNVFVLFNETRDNNMK